VLQVLPTLSQCPEVPVLRRPISPLARCACIGAHAFYKLRDRPLRPPSVKVTYDSIGCRSRVKTATVRRNLLAMHCNTRFWWPGRLGRKGTCPITRLQHGTGTNLSTTYRAKGALLVVRAGSVAWRPNSVSGPRGALGANFRGRSIPKRWCHVGPGLPYAGTQGLRTNE
jgi:hypothetical protein